MKTRSRRAPPSDGIAASGGTPVVVASDSTALGVVHVEDVAIREAAVRRLTLAADRCISSSGAGDRLVARASPGGAA